MFASTVLIDALMGYCLLVSASIQFHCDIWSFCVDMTIANKPMALTFVPILFSIFHLKQWTIKKATEKKTKKNYT